MRISRISNLKAIIQHTLGKFDRSLKKFREILDNKYLILRKLGWGHFSTVWLAIKIQDRQLYALKIQKSAEKYTESALEEEVCSLWLLPTLGNFVWSSPELQESLVGEGCVRLLQKSWLHNYTIRHPQSADVWLVLPQLAKRTTLCYGVWGSG